MSLPAPTTTLLETLLNDLQAHCDSMPPVRAMGITVAAFDGQTLRMNAPLALNVNDKGSAFGGSLTALLTLAGWGLVTLQCQLRGLKADVYVADSQIRYLAPLLGDLQAQASVAATDVPGDAWQGFFTTLAARGRARIQLQAEVWLPDGGVATTLSGRYVAITGK